MEGTTIVFKERCKQEQPLDTLEIKVLSALGSSLAAATFAFAAKRFAALGTSTVAAVGAGAPLLKKELTTVEVVTVTVAAGTVDVSSLVTTVVEYEVVVLIWGFS